MHNVLILPLFISPSFAFPSVFRPRSLDNRAPHAGPVMSLLRPAPGMKASALRGPEALTTSFPSPPASLVPQQASRPAKATGPGTCSSLSAALPTHMPPALRAQLQRCPSSGAWSLAK